MTGVQVKHVLYCYASDISEAYCQNSPFTRVTVAHIIDFPDSNDVMVPAEGGTGSGSGTQSHRVLDIAVV